MKNSITAGVLAVTFAFASGGIAYADSDHNEGKKDKDWERANAGIIAQFELQIKSLKGQIEALKHGRATTSVSTSTASHDDDDRDAFRKEKKELQAEIKQTRKEMRFVRKLSRGMSGDDVRDLQELLAQDPDVFPEGLITGFFGPTTEKALKRFQKKHGLDQVGVLGPLTQARLLALFAGRELPPGIAKRFGFASTTASTTPGFGLVTVCHMPPGANKHTLVINVNALSAHLAHGDALGICPQQPGTTTPPVADTVAPIISQWSVSNVSSSTAQISWNTNETATSKVWYGTTTPVVLAAPTLSVSNTTLVSGHTLSLTGLTASTTYHYVIESRDAANNAATTSAASFTTL